MRGTLPSAPPWGARMQGPALQGRAATAHPARSALQRCVGPARGSRSLASRPCVLQLHHKPDAHTPTPTSATTALAPPLRPPAGPVAHVQRGLPLLRHLLLRLLPHVLPHGRAAAGGWPVSFPLSLSFGSWGVGWSVGGPRVHGPALVCAAFRRSWASPVHLDGEERGEHGLALYGRHSSLCCSLWHPGLAACPCPAGAGLQRASHVHHCRQFPAGAYSSALCNPPTVQAKPYTLWRVVVDALAAGMLVTCLLDFWRIGLGGIVEDGGQQQGGLPWLQ